MNVLILHSRYMSGAASGENKGVEDDARLLSEAGHTVDVWAPSAAELGGRARAGTSAVWSRRATREVRARIRALDPDVVHCHNLWPALSPAVLRAIDGPPIVMKLANYRMHCLPSNFFRDGRVCEDCKGHLPWRGVVHRCYQGSALAGGVLAASFALHRAAGSFERVRLFQVLSEFVRHKHIEAGIPGDRIRVAPTFAWPSLHREGPGDYFLYLGRLTVEKGVEVLVRGWTETSGRLVIVGEGPEEEHLRALATASVEIRPTVPFTAVPALVAGARAVMLPSIWDEPFGRVLIEAYAAGVPVVASAAGGIPEVVAHDRSGLLVAPGDADGWRAATLRLMDDEESVRLGEGAYARWQERYTPERGLEHLESLYAAALEPAGEGGSRGGPGRTG